jgi:hypothetical protein
MGVHTRWATLVAGVTAVALSGCGVESGETLRSPGTDVTTTESPTTTTAATTTAVPAAIPEATTAATTTTTLPGDPFDAAFWPAGAVLDVAGVAFDEVLSMHALPGDAQPVVASLPPLTRGVVSTGRARLVEIGLGGIWVEVTADGATGWVVSGNLVYLAGPRDVTADVVSSTGGTPTASSMLALGEIVTDALVPSDPTSLPRIVVAAAPGAGTTSDVVYDTFPGEAFGGDASIGSRYVVTGRQVPSGSLPPTGFAAPVVYELVSVDQIQLCTRGATEDDRCV